MHFSSAYERHVYSGFEPSQAFDVVHGGHFEHRLLSAGQAHMEHQRLLLGDIRLETGTYDFPVVARGAMPQGVICVGLMADGAELTRYNTASIGIDEVQIYPPGVDLLYHAAGASRWINFVLPQAQLQQMAVAGLGRPLRLPQGHAISVRLRPGLRGALVQLADDAFALGRALEPYGIDADLAAGVAREVVAGYVEALCGAEAHARGAGEAAASRHLQIILACERLALSAAEAAEAGLADIALRSGYSRRALELIFKRGVGMPPGRWFMNVRLNGALRDLLTPRPGCRVADVAEKWGFRHLPRFAGHYRRAFGELPSLTLRRALLRG